MSKYIYWVRKDLFGCFRYKGDRDKVIETILKERGGTEMSTTVLPFTITIITIYYSDTINTLKLEKKIIFTIVDWDLNLR
jgi:hypothetical protein